MNYYYIALLMAYINVLLGISFIFIIDQLKYEYNLMLEYFLLYLFTMFLSVICFNKSRYKDRFLK